MKNIKNQYFELDFEYSYKNTEIKNKLIDTRRNIHESS